ncbi:MAG: hypothetical protein HS128_02330 [Ideonella sp.]|nr:hypothetical protein [Ideonella sp.]MCC7458579.1 hypothetical protein [Nitrospira sp.]
MNKLTTLATAVVAAVGFSTSALAQEVTQWDRTDTVSTALRSDVSAQAAAALKAGQIAHGEASRFVIESDGTKSRAQVKAETRAAQRLGLIDQGEVSVVSTPEQIAQVHAAGLRALDAPIARAN